MSQTSLKLWTSHMAVLREQMESRPTEEVCGLMGGIWSPYPLTALVQQIVPMRNVATTPQVRYLMEAREQVQVMTQFDRQGWQAVGIYHSHPGGQPIPSPTDIAEATYPDAVYVIGVPGGDIRAWRIVRGFVSTCEIALVDE